MPLWKKILIGFGVFWAIGITASLLLGSGEKSSPPLYEPKPKQAEKPKASSIVASCQVEWERSNKQNLHDPNSLEWDHNDAEFGIYKNKTPVVTVAYRAKNAMGALVKNTAVCAINSETREVISIIK